MQSQRRGEIHLTLDSKLSSDGSFVQLYIVDQRYWTKWHATNDHSYIPYQAPHRAFPDWVASSAARETKEVANEPISG
jgi:hypothetical protein